MRKIHYIALAIAVLAAALWLLTPPSLRSSETPIELPEDLDAWLADSERVIGDRYGLVAGTEKRIRWQQTGARTSIAIVSLHGFSASRQELAPLAEILADELGANLFETRLSGHGHERQPMHDTLAEDWLRDAREALAVGAAIGDEIVLIGTSTGATLALAALDDVAMQRVRSIIMVSPNIAPADPAAQWLTRPAGPLLMRLLAGDTRHWEAHNEAQATFWSTTYPTAATVEVMRLADRAAAQTELPITQELLVLQSPFDQVVSPAATIAMFERIVAPRKELIEYRNSQDPKHHILAGDIMSPATTEEVATIILAFLRSRAE